MSDLPVSHILLLCAIASALIYGLLLPPEALLIALVASLLVPISIPILSVQVSLSILVAGIVAFRAVAKQLRANRSRSFRGVRRSRIPPRTFAHASRLSGGPKAIERQAETRNSPGALGSFVLAAFAFVSVIASYPGLRDGVTQGLSYAIPILVFPLGLMLLGPTPYQKVTRIVILGGALYAIYLLLVNAGVSSVGVTTNPDLILSNGISRLSSSAVPVNGISVILVLPLLALQARLIQRRRIEPLMLVAGGLTAYAFLLTFSRNGILTLVVAEALLVSVAQGTRRWVARTAVLATAGAVAFVLAQGGSTVVAAYTRATGFVNYSGNDLGATSHGKALALSLGERFWLWKGGVQVFLHHPLTGVGLGPLGANIPSRPHGVVQQSYFFGAQNTYSSMLAIGGGVGFVCLLLFLVPTCKWIFTRLQALRRSRMTPDRVAYACLAVWVLAVLFSSVFDDLLFMNGPITAIWGIGGAMCIRSLGRESEVTPRRAEANRGQRLVPSAIQQA